MFRRTCLDDDSHVAFAERFGELDDITPYIAAGRKHRLKHVQLFDVSNVDIDGNILDPESPRGQANKVVLSKSYTPYCLLLHCNSHFFSLKRETNYSTSIPASIRDVPDTLYYLPTNCHRLA